MDKKILIMCTGNSCRSIIAEALVNSKLNGVKAYSCGVSPSGKVNINAKRVLEQNNIWQDSYYSKHLDEVIDIDFDLVVTVCSHAQESCPAFPEKTVTIHVGFDDPDGKEFEAFEATYKEIKEVLLPIVKEKLEIGDKMNKKVFKLTDGVKINFTGAVAKEQIVKMVENCSKGACECMSNETKRRLPICK